MMILPAAAEAAVRQHAPVLAPELRPLGELCGRILREPVFATRDQPPFDRVTMDGIALAVRDWRRDTPLRIAGTQAAGAAPLTLQHPGTCFEVMTGAMLPSGCDCVVPVERVTIRDDQVWINDDITPVSGLNVHARGRDCPTGKRLLEPGTLLGPPEVAVIASAGHAAVQVSREPRIAVISTGDELIEPGEPLRDWQIHRSNVYAVLATLQNRGYRQLTQDHLPDDERALHERLHQHLAENDVLILSGGVSMGKFDFVPKILDELGVRIVFHKIAQRPGKPMWFGVSPHGKAVYALPGNPVSTMVCLSRYTLPGLEAATAATASGVTTVSLAEDFEVKPALTFFLPVQLVPRPDGGLSAQPRPTQGSGDFTSLIGTDGFVELPAGPRVCRRGEPVPFYRW